MRSQPRREALTIPGPAGALEAMIEWPSATPPAGYGVVCHPHPLHGGTMDNKVVHTLCRSFTDVGRAAVRFNFRGAGASDGGYDGGEGEVEDALAVMSWALERVGGAPWLAGFSFGAAVALHAAAREQPRCLITVAPPVGRLPVATERQPDCPWLVVHGEEDELVDADAVLEWVNELEPGPELIMLSGVDHFFHGRLTLLREKLVAWLADQDTDND